jgi:hypothetical protein
MLPGDPADPDMCVHLWPGLDPGAVEALGDGLVAVVAVDELCAFVEEVEALAMLSPNARVAPSTAAPAAVPMSGLVILTRFSFRSCPPGTARLGDPCTAATGWGGPGDPVSAGRWPGAGQVPARSQYAKPS